MKFEYKLFKLDMYNTHLPNIDILNKLGQEGWQVILSRHYGEYGDEYLLLKRTIEIETHVTVDSVIRHMDYLAERDMLPKGLKEGIIDGIGTKVLYKSGV